MRRTCRCALLPVLALACWPATAAGQSGPALLIAPSDPAEAARLPDFRMPRGDYRAPPGPVRNGLIGAVPLGRNLQVAVGRFAVPDIAAPREAAEIRRRDRRIAALGFSFRF